MTTIERAGHRRRVLVIVALAVAVGAGVVVAVIGFVLDVSQLVLLGAQLVITVLGVSFWMPGGLRSLSRLREAVRRALPESSTTTVVRVAASRSSDWLGRSALVTPYLVLVDDDEGLALWTRRSGSAIEVVRWSWRDVREAAWRDDGEGVDVRMVDSSVPTVTLLPADPDAESASDRLRSPSRNRALAAHLQHRIRGTDRGLHGPGEPRRSGDVDWLG